MIIKERFTDTAWTSGDLQKATTSPSQTALSNWMWFLKYQLIPYLNFKSEKDSISFKAGSFIHDWFQNILLGIAKIEDVESHFKNLIDHIDLDEKKSMKAKFILKFVKQYVENHLKAVEEISNNKMQSWGKELFFSDWYEDKYMGQTLNLANEGYIDCYNHELKIITEHKNRFGNARNSPLKSKTKTKDNDNRMGDWVYSKSQKISNPQFTHCIQTAVYSKHFDYQYKPYLVYVSESDYTIFSPDNCWELSEQGLKYFFRKFIQINIQRQEMLRISGGDIRKLACMIGVDWSEIRHYKNNFMLENYEDEDMQKLENFYDKL